MLASRPRRDRRWPAGGAAAGPAGPRRAAAGFSRLGWLTAAFVLLAGGGFAGYEYLGQPHVGAPVRSPTAAQQTPTPNFDPALGKWQYIGTRAEDPQPLTLEQLFPAKLNGSSYARTGSDSLTGNCSLAVFGADLQAALRAGQCTQVLRASYISADGTMMGTVGVANLVSSDAAGKACQVTGPQEIIAPLAAQNGPTSKLGDGTGVAQALIKGHYLILTWAEFSSLKTPSTSAQRQQLAQFTASMLSGSANVDLSTRMEPDCADGRPTRQTAICKTAALSTLTVIAPASLATPSAVAAGSP